VITLRDGETSARRPSVVTIGVFDGLHRGHQAVIAQLLGLGVLHDAAASVVTFDPSPAMVLAPTKAPRLLATLEQRLEGFETLGVDQVRVLTFNATLASESARHFIERVLVGELDARAVIVGEDFHFGHNREGNVALLRAVGEDFGFDVVAASLFGDDQPWSSTSVRRALDAGDLASARRILGRPFSVRGEVTHGDQRGGELGYPTANLDLADHQQLPSEGVYAGVTFLGGAWRAAAISIGTRPQFYDDGALLVEVFVLDFDANLYGRTLDVVFLARLRDQATFEDVERLTEQIARDVEQTRAIADTFSASDVKLLG
jgi:riboflavin kinase/FMN adenylyltransferase